MMGVDMREYASPKGLAIRTVNSHMVQAPRASRSNGTNACIEYMNCCTYVGVFSLPHFFFFLSLAFIGNT